MKISNLKARPREVMEVRGLRCILDTVDFGRLKDEN